MSMETPPPHRRLSHSPPSSRHNSAGHKTPKKTNPGSASNNNSGYLSPEWSDVPLASPTPLQTEPQCPVTPKKMEFWLSLSNVDLWDEIPEASSNENDFIFNTPSKRTNNSIGNRTPKKTPTQRTLQRTPRIPFGVLWDRTDTSSDPTEPIFLNRLENSQEETSPYKQRIQNEMDQLPHSPAQALKNLRHL